MIQTKLDEIRERYENAIWKSMADIAFTMTLVTPINLTAKLGLKQAKGFDGLKLQPNQMFIFTLENYWGGHDERREN